MKTPSLPVNEAARLEALRQYEILDTTREQAFDDLTFVAAHTFGVPIALVSLVDAGRQWFKSRVGLDVAETSRDISFCGHAILQDAAFVVHDALEDERFVDNPLVLSDPHIRFYAGAPLVTTDGHALGTFCVMDRTPRQFGEAEQMVLQALGRLAMVHLESRRNASHMATILKRTIA